MTEDNNILNNKRFCECGCGTEISEFRTDGKPRKFVNHHHAKGSNNGNWKNGRRKRNDGYVLIWKPNHPYAAYNGGYVKEHRLVMEKHIGRFLKRDEIIHHINEKRDDNRIENLQLTNRSNHNVIHFTKKREIMHTL